MIPDATVFNDSSVHPNHLIRADALRDAEQPPGSEWWRYDLKLDGFPAIGLSARLATMPSSCFFLTTLADSAMVMNGYAALESEHHLNRYHELAQRLGDTTQIFYSLVWRSVLAAFRLELDKAQDIGWKLTRKIHER